MQCIFAFLSWHTLFSRNQPLRRQKCPRRYNLSEVLLFSPFYFFSFLQQHFSGNSRSPFLRTIAIGKQRDEKRSFNASFCLNNNCLTFLSGISFSFFENFLPCPSVVILPCFFTRFFFGFFLANRVVYLV